MDRGFVFRLISSYMENFNIGDVRVSCAFTDICYRFDKKLNFNDSDDVNLHLYSTLSKLFAQVLFYYTYK